MMSFQNLRLLNIKNSLKSKDFIDFYKNATSFNKNDNKKDRFIVGTLKTSDKKLLEANSDDVYLSMESLHIHKNTHKDVILEDYQKLPDIIAEGEIWNKERKKYVLLKLGKFTYRAALKVTQNSSENYLTSLIKISDKKASKEIRKKYKRIR
jgi:hypothetical protein